MESNKSIERGFLTLLCVMMACAELVAQVNQLHYSSENLVSKEPVKISVAKITKDWKPSLRNLEMPSPGGKSYRSFLLREKEKIAFTDYKFSKSAQKVATGEADKPILVRGFEGNLTDGWPNDNDLAISNDGKLISVINSTISVYDTKTDSVLLDISLPAFADTLLLSAHMYDPKTIYDPKLDKFIMVWLAGNTDSTSNIIVSFSETNDPSGNWFIYALAGDPLNNGTWSDFPMVAISDDELFITVNSLINDTFPPQVSDSWKFLFQESVIWQINKQSGFNGQALQMKYYNNIKYGNRSIRNLCPIQGGSTTYGPNIYLLSNRNFDLQNDTIFILEVTGLLAASSTQLKINVSKADVPYGLSPDARQVPGQLFLQTNDARPLSGYWENGVIHYVQNTVEPDSNTSAIYHGMISNLTSAMNVTGQIIGGPFIDLGYPNISYTGKFPGDDEAMISFNYSAHDSFPGFAAVFYNGNTGYSEIVTAKGGENYINPQGSSGSGNKKRWGDYTGSQRKYDEPGKVWAVGTFGTRVGFSNTYGTWITELASPDTSLPASIAVARMKDGRVRAYPNPVDNRVSVEFELPEDALVNISLIDIHGRMVKEFINDKIKKGSNLFSFSLEPLPAGIYFLTIRDKKNQITSKRIVKQ